MRSNWRLCLLLGALLLLAGARGEEPSAGEELVIEEEPEEDVDKNVVSFAKKAELDSLIEKNKMVLVLFYNDKLDYGQVYSAAADKLKELKPEVVLAKTNAAKTHSQYRQCCGVDLLPKLVWFVDGRWEADFNGKASTDETVQWVLKKASPPSTQVQSLDDLAQHKAAKVAVLGFFKELEGQAHEAFEKAAHTIMGPVFLKTTSQDVANYFGITQAPGYAIGRNFPGFSYETVASEGHEAFEDMEQSIQEQLKAFLKIEGLPAYLEFTSANVEDIRKAAKQVMVIAPEKALEKGSQLLKDVTKAASSLKGKVLFVVSTAGTPRSDSLVATFNLKEDPELIQVAAMDSGESVKFRFEGAEVTAEALKEFAKGVVDGTAPRVSVSEPIPTGEDAVVDGITIVVGDTVDTIVKDPTKDVMLMLHAPWSNFADYLMPTYVKLAKRFAGVPSIVIARLDNSKNQHPDINAKIAPLFVLFPAGEGSEAVTYEGGKYTLSDLTKFIKDNAKLPFELSKKKRGKKKAVAEEDKIEL